MRTILLVAGDPSGDAHGALLIRALKSERPSLRAAAVGGSLMRREADEFLEDLASMGVAGFWEPAAKLPHFWRLRRRIQDYLRNQKPAAVVCIDYYGFNRWVLEAAREAGIPAYYYVSPQVWASRPGRIQVLARLVKRMFVIFPFEEKLYRDAGVPVSFVGHPLLDRLPDASAKIPSGKLRLGLLPGSRGAEVSRHLPLFLAALDRLRASRPEIEALVFAAPSLPDSAYADAASRGVPIVRESDYSSRSTLDLALCSSGTATLENALLGVPMVVVYRTSWPTYWIARALIRVPFISMANLLAGKALVPELIQGEATPAKIAEAAQDVLKAPAALRRELLALRGSLGNPGASSRAAKAILQEIEPAQVPAKVP